MFGLGNLLRRIEWRTNGVFPPVITVLVAINVLAFFIDAGTEQTLTMWGAARWDLVSHGQVWRLLTAGFLHANITHLLFNLVFYCFFANKVHRHLGAGRFLWLTIFAIVFGNFLQVLYSGLGFETSSTQVIGFSGAFLATIIAFATITPHARCFLLIFQVPAWLLATILVLLDLAGLSQNQGHTAYLAHLGGAATGFCYIRYPSLFAWTRWFQRFSDNITAGVERRRAAIQAKDAAKLDELLEKVSEHGLPALTEAERTFLTKYSQKKKN